MEQGGAGPFSQKYKAGHTAQAHCAAVFDSSDGSLSDGGHISKHVAFGDHRQKQDGYRAGQGIGEKNQGHGHTGENPINAQSRHIVIAVEAQAGRNGDGFHALEKVQNNTVCGQRQRHLQQSAVQILTSLKRPGQSGGKPSCGPACLPRHAGQYGGYGKEHGEQLAYGEAQNSDADGRSLSGRDGKGGNYVHTAYPGQLLQQLGDSRNPCFFYSVKVSVDTGMDSGKGYGEGEDAKHGGRARLLKQVRRDRVCQLPDCQVAQQRQGQGNA